MLYIRRRFCIDGEREHSRVYESHGNPLEPFSGPADLDIKADQWDSSSFVANAHGESCCLTRLSATGTSFDRSDQQRAKKSSASPMDR